MEPAADSSTRSNTYTGSLATRPSNSYILKYQPTPAISHVRKEKYIQRRSNILFVTSEFAGLIKAGGLGDVSSALPEALTTQHDVRVLIPGYRQVINSGHPMEIVGKLDAFAGLPEAHIGRMKWRTGLVIYVVLCPELYDREGGAYGDLSGTDWADNPIRFARLSMAAAEVAAGNCNLPWQPDVVHANDWPTALTPAYMHWRQQKTPTVFTVHNLAHHGIYSWEHAVDLGLPLEAFSIDGLEFHGKFSLLKGGINYATHVTTVSETYAREITTPEFGSGLHGLLHIKYQHQKLAGITNGIESAWKPEWSAQQLHDCAEHHALVSDLTNFSIEDMPRRKWALKRSCKRHVEQMFNLPASDAPLFAVVSRLVHQKGVDLTVAVAERIVSAGGRLVVMGCGERELERELVQLSQRYPQHVGVHIGFNESESRHIFAGSDFLLMPSRFEPCGLSQMYAQRVGSLPIAHKTGGLADTIISGVTGFLFNECTVDSYGEAIGQAMDMYNHSDIINAMRFKAMMAPQTWQQAVRPYHQLYQQLIDLHHTPINERAGASS